LIQNYDRNYFKDLQANENFYVGLLPKAPIQMNVGERLQLAQSSPSGLTLDCPLLGSNRTKPQ
jgi:hypothetical protein